jgi:hypothetical protein
MLQDTIGNLSPLYREVLLLRDAEEFSIEETATALAITIGTAKVTMRNASRETRLGSKQTTIGKNALPLEPVFPDAAACHQKGALFEFLESRPMRFKSASSPRLASVR